MNLTRRQLFNLATGAALFAAFGRTTVRADFSAAELAAIRERASRIIKEYDAQGIHRTATETDEKSAKWLAKLVAEAGAKPRLEAFEINRVDLLENRLEIGDKRIEGVPMFDGGFTDKNGIRGTIGKMGSVADIGFLEAPPNAATDFNDAFIEARRNSKHKAIVVVTKGGADGLALINAPYFLQPFAQPALQIGREHADFIKQSAEKNVEIRLIANVKRRAKKAFNVTAEITGTDLNLAPVGVITPRSGWWQIAAERGGGLCAWLETMRAVAQIKPRRTFYFAACSGHELGHVGLENYLDSRADLAKRARVWLHFGANIGARLGASRNLRTSDEELEKRAVRALTEAGIAPDKLMPRDAVPNGEAKNLFKRGGKFISLIGGNNLFHLPQDRFPDSLDLDVIARVCATFAKLAVEFANSPTD